MRVYADRPEGVVPMNVSLYREAAEVLDRLAPTKKARGALLSRALLAYVDIQTARTRWLDTVLDGGSVVKEEGV
jgi:hypothetical protein